MAKKTGLARVLWGGLIVGLLMVAGCQEGVATSPGSVGEPQAAQTPPVAAPTESAQGDMQPEGPAPKDGVKAESAQISESAPDEAAQAVELTLRFVQGQVATYRVTTEGRKSVAWKGDPTAKPAWFSDGDAGNRLEMVFRQRVEEVEPEGNALLAITIEGLKYLGETPKKVVIDFDSAAGGDPNSPLAALIGKSYRLKMSTKGEVLAVMGLDAIGQVTEAGSPAAAAALSVVSEDEVRKRHRITPLTLLKDPSVRPGQTWSDIRTFSFGNLGRKSYERLYTFEEVRQDNGRVAVVEMEGIPPVPADDESFGQRNPMMVDASGSYKGRLELDLDSGQVRRYVEQMRAEWIAADPSTLGGDAELAALEMAATWLHRLEHVD